MLFSETSISYVIRLRSRRNLFSLLSMLCKSITVTLSRNADSRAKCRMASLTGNDSSAAILLGNGTDFMFRARRTRLERTMWLNGPVDVQNPDCCNTSSNTMRSPFRAPCR